MFPARSLLAAGVPVASSSDAVDQPVVRHQLTMTGDRRRPGCGPTSASTDQRDPNAHDQRRLRSFEEDRAHQAGKLADLVLVSGGHGACRWTSFRHRGGHDHHRQPRLHAANGADDPPDLGYIAANRSPIPAKSRRSLRTPGGLSSVVAVPASSVQRPEAVVPVRRKREAGDRGMDRGVAPVTTSGITGTSSATIRWIRTLPSARWRLGKAEPGESSTVGLL
jgi:hypothetical protein